MLYLEGAGAIEEATDLPYFDNPSVTYHSITPTGMRMLREAGRLP